MRHAARHRRAGALVTALIDGGHAREVRRIGVETAEAVADPLGRGRRRRR